MPSTPIRREIIKPTAYEVQSAYKLLARDSVYTLNALVDTGAGICRPLILEMLEEWHPDKGGNEYTNPDYFTETLSAWSVLERYWNTAAK